MTTKLCIKCNKKKPLSAFHNKKAAKDGKQSRCKECNSKSARTWQAENPDKFRKNWEKQYGSRKKRAAKYGLTIEEFDLMTETSKGLCKICSNPPKKWLVIDHCHTTGKVRGLLCESCNLGLGIFKDNPILLQNAIKYLAGL